MDKVAAFNPTREELDYFRRNKIEIVLPNGMKVTAPALNVLGAVLSVLSPEQKTRVFEIVCRTGSKPFMYGSALTTPVLPNGYTNGLS